MCGATKSLDMHIPEHPIPVKVSKYVPLLSKSVNNHYHFHIFNGGCLVSTIVFLQWYETMLKLRKHRGLIYA